MTGISIEFPTGYGGLIKDRSGIAVKKSCHVIAGVIDEDYRGEIGIVMTNLSAYTTQYFNPGDRIAQLVLIPTVSFPVEAIGEVSATKRGSGAWGSSGE
jgi:dUTP pyrophosphatase